VQVALLTARINGPQTITSRSTSRTSPRRGLLRMVSWRRKLLDYLKTRNPDSYRTLIETGLRK
jgi:small subunit ribosomal protein S15